MAGTSESYYAASLSRTGECGVAFANAKALFLCINVMNVLSKGLRLPNMALAEDEVFFLSFFDSVNRRIDKMLSKQKVDNVIPMMEGTHMPSNADSDQMTVFAQVDSVFGLAIPATKIYGVLPKVFVAELPDDFFPPILQDDEICFFPITAAICSPPPSNTLVAVKVKDVSGFFTTSTASSSGKRGRAENLEPMKKSKKQLTIEQVVEETVKEIPPRPVKTAPVKVTTKTAAPVELVTPLTKKKVNRYMDSDGATTGASSASMDSEIESPPLSLSRTPEPIVRVARHANLSEIGLTSALANQPVVNPVRENRVASYNHLPIYLPRDNDLYITASNKPPGQIRRYRESSLNFEDPAFQQQLAVTRGQMKTAWNGLRLSLHWRSIWHGRDLVGNHLDALLTPQSQQENFLEGIEGMLRSEMEVHMLFNPCLMEEWHSQWPRMQAVGWRAYDLTDTSVREKVLDRIIPKDELPPETPLVYAYEPLVSLVPTSQIQAGVHLFVSKLAVVKFMARFPYLLQTDDRLYETLAMHGWERDGDRVRLPEKLQTNFTCDWMDLQVLRHYLFINPQLLFAKYFADFGESRIFTAVTLCPKLSLAVDNESSSPVVDRLSSEERRSIKEHAVVVARKITQHLGRGNSTSLPELRDQLWNSLQQLGWSVSVASWTDKWWKREFVLNTTYAKLNSNSGNSRAQLGIDYFFSLDDAATAINHDADFVLRPMTPKQAKALAEKHVWIDLNQSHYTRDMRILSLVLNHDDPFTAYNLKEMLEDSGWRIFTPQEGQSSWVFVHPAKAAITTTLKAAESLQKDKEVFFGCESLIDALQKCRGDVAALLHTRRNNNKKSAPTIPIAEIVDSASTEPPASSSGINRAAIMIESSPKKEKKLPSPGGKKKQTGNRPEYEVMSVEWQVIDSLEQGEPFGRVFSLLKLLGFAAYWLRGGNGKVILPPGTLRNLNPKQQPKGGYVNVSGLVANRDYWVEDTDGKAALFAHILQYGFTHCGVETTPTPSPVPVTKPRPSLVVVSNAERRASLREVEPINMSLALEDSSARQSPTTAPNFALKSLTPTQLTQGGLDIANSYVNRLADECERLTPLLDEPSPLAALVAREFADELDYAPMYIPADDDDCQPFSQPVIAREENVKAPITPPHTNRTVVAHTPRKDVQVSAIDADGVILDTDDDFIFDCNAPEINDTQLQTLLLQDRMDPAAIGGHLVKRGKWTSQFCSRREYPHLSLPDNGMGVCLYFRPSVHPSMTGIELNKEYFCAVEPMLIWLRRTVLREDYATSRAAALKAVVDPAKASAAKAKVVKSAPKPVKTPVRSLLNNAISPSRKSPSRKSPARKSPLAKTIENMDSTPVEIASGATIGEYFNSARRLLQPNSGGAISAFPVICREAECETLTQAVTSSLNDGGNHGAFVYVTGSSGTGKTLTVESFVHVLSESNPTLKVLRLNGASTDSTDEMMYQDLLRQMGAGNLIANSRATESQLRAISSSSKMPVIIIVSEIDKLRINLFNILHEWSQQLSVVLIGTGNTVNFLQAGINATEIVFKPYTNHQLEAILTSRAGKVWDDFAVKLLCNKVMSHKCDVRQLFNAATATMDAAITDVTDISAPVAKVVMSKHVTAVMPSMDQTANMLGKLSKSSPSYCNLLTALLVCHTSTTAESFTESDARTAYTTYSAQRRLPVLLADEITSVLTNLVNYSLLTRNDKGRYQSIVGVDSLLKIDSLPHSLREDLLKISTAI